MKLFVFGLFLLTLSTSSFAFEVPQSWSTISLQCLPPSFPTPPESNPNKYRRLKLFCCKAKAQDLVKINEIKTTNEYYSFVQYCFKNRN